MRLQSIIKYVSRFLEPTRVFIALMLAAVLYFLPLNSKPEFIEQNGQILEIAQVHPVLQSVYPQGIYATCGDGGTGTNCHTGCCSAGQCVVCPQDEDPPSPPTISANLNCSDWGDNGWCKGSLSIDLAAADPQGQAVVISGAVNGNNFACPSGATSCSIPLSGEGTGSVSYQVNSATGLSAAGSLGYQIDLTSPDLDTSVSGAAGTNGWYRSDVTLGVSASDATSGIASITASINGGGATSVGGSLTFSDGEYSVLIVARDNAGHVTQDTQTIKVDTITPSLSFTSSGTNGKNGWYVSSASATATAGDSGSGLASIEASVDGGGWTVSDSISLGDGVHTYQFRATDVAGNKTETPTQTALVDTIAPSISMSQGTSLGDKVLYEIEDYGSGLSIFRAVIEDDDEAYQKVVWSGDISGSYIADDILWDGKFADGTKAGIGEYMVTLKITDAAGNKAIKATFVTVGLLDLLDDIPAFAPPISSTSEEDEIPTTASTTGPQTFGGIPTITNAGEFISTTSTVSGITIPTTNIPLDPNILWGAAATAMVGATLADWQRKREEEERRKAEERRRRAEEGGGNVTAKRLGLKAQEDAVRQRWAEQARQERSNNASTARWEGLAKQEEAKQQARINDANAARWAGLAAMEQKKEEEKKAGVSKVLASLTNLKLPTFNDVELRKYGIQTIGLDNSHQLKLMEAVNIFGNYYRPWIGNVTPNQAFSLTHGSILVVVDKDAVVEDDPIHNANCKTQNNTRITSEIIGKLKLSPQIALTEKNPYGYLFIASYQRKDGENILIPTDSSQLIVCRTQPDQFNIMHELTHAFDNQFKNITKGSLFLSDYLWKLSDGTRNIRITSDGMTRTGYGFKNEGEYPIRQNTFGDNLYEELADTAMNAALDGNPNYPDFGFSNDPAGDARRNDFHDLLSDTWQPGMKTYFDSMIRLFE